MMVPAIKKDISLKCMAVPRIVQADVSSSMKLSNGSTWRFSKQTPSLFHPDYEMDSSTSTGEKRNIHIFWLGRHESKQQCHARSFDQETMGL